MHEWRRLGVAALVVAAIGVAACGADPMPNATQRPGGTTTHLAPPDGSPLPKVDGRALHQLYDPAVERLGLRMTRIGLFEATDRSVASANGTHLAMYAESTRPLSPDDYMHNFVALVQMFTNDVFTRWPGVQSFDICQEVAVGADGTRTESTSPTTAFEITRDVAANHDVSTMNLPDILALGTGVSVFVGTPASDSELYREAVARRSPSSAATLPGTQTTVRRSRYGG